MYQQEQNRTESNQGMHFHVHQCVCTSPLYNPYRQPPLIAPPYVTAAPPPLPRPYNLAHYQYTSYNIPYNVPVFNPTAITHQAINPGIGGMVTQTQAPNGSETRRMDDVQQSDIPNIRNAMEENQAEDFGAMSCNIQAPEDPNTESFTKFLESGCVMAEKIAIRNQHRPCFKNIQNLCNRTKNEILKPSHTVSNIHSQGIPWATKDFIYAYVRLINCWHMLKGYLQVKEGTLGNIDRELTGDFKNCYAVWESNTKDLAEHMIRIFSNLDNNVSNPNGSSSQVTNRQVTNRTVGTPVTNNRLVVNPNMMSSLDVSSNNLLDVVMPSNSSIAVDENNQFSETTTETSPREEESDGESRVYMKPGSYNVPKKGNNSNNNNSSNNSSPSIEFFETAKNISAHYMKLEAAKKSASGDSNSNCDKDWKNAISASCNLIKKNNAGCTFEECNTLDESDGCRSVCNQSQQLSSNADVEHVRRWLYQDHHLHHQQQQQPQPNFANEMLHSTADKSSSVTVLQRNEMMQNKRKDDEFRKFTGSGNKAEGDAMKMLLDELEKSDFNQTLISAETIVRVLECNLQNVIHKFNCKIYKGPEAMICDLKRIASKGQNYFNNDPRILKEIKEFIKIIDDFLLQQQRPLSFDLDEFRREVSINKKYHRCAVEDLDALSSGNHKT